MKVGTHACVCVYARINECNPCNPFRKRFSGKLCRPGVVAYSTFYGNFLGPPGVLAAETSKLSQTSSAVVGMHE